MVLKIYGHSFSTCTRTVEVVLEEKKVPYEVIAVNVLKGEHKQAEYLEKHPFGVIPYIDDDGFILYESRAIARYIARKYASQGTPLIPTELKAEALFEQAASIETSYFFKHASAAAYEGIFKKRRGLEIDQTVLEGHLRELGAKMDVYDKILGKQKYLAGDEVTLADLFHLPYGYELNKAGFEWQSSRPNVARWWKAISSRPSWIAVKDGLA